MFLDHPKPFFHHFQEIVFWAAVGAQALYNISTSINKYDVETVMFDVDSIKYWIILALLMLAFGSFYESKLKPDAKKANIKVLKWAKTNVKKPIVVIGGINDKNYKKLILQGANYIAISSFIWDNPALKPENAIKKFK